MPQVEYLKSVGIRGAMIGRQAIINPSIFNELKGIRYPSLNSIKEEYVLLSQKYGSSLKYQKNVLKHIGNPEAAINPVS